MKTWKFEMAKAQNKKNPVTEVLSILFFGSAAFSIVSLMTYHPNDPSLFTQTSQNAQNLCGWVGAYFADVLLQAVGLSAFLIPAALFFLAAIAHYKEGLFKTLGTFFGMMITVLALSVFVTIQWKFWPYQGALLLTGGAVGAWLAHLLSEPFNSTGASIVSLAVFALSLSFSTPLSVAKLLGQGLKKITLFSAKALRLIASAGIYLLGTGMMKAAHSTGDLLQSTIEGAIEKAKLRAEQKALLASQESKASASLAEPELEEDIEVECEEYDAEESDEDEEDDAEDDTLEMADDSEEDDLEEDLEDDAIDIGQLKKEDSLKILPYEVSELEKKKISKMTKGNWKLPTPEFLRKAPKIESSIDKQKLIENSKKLEQKFADFGIQGEVTAVRPGPVITLYEFRPGPGIKVSRIASMADDLSMALSAKSVRILAPLPGKSVVGIEIPSDSREKVFLREFLQSKNFFDSEANIPVVMGKDIAGQPQFSDLARMPHLLIAGQTGSGKSVFMNSLICSLLYRFTPDELRMILVDPKFIEFRSYQDIPHLLLPVVDDPNNANTALKWAVREMERRYRILALMGVRNLASYNKKVEEMGAEVVYDLLISEDEDTKKKQYSSGADWIQSFEMDEEGLPIIGKLPYNIIIIDELADLMMVAKKEVEISIARIAQKARAAGIHLVIATQRPSTDVITGLIKANLPSRISFNLASYVDSKTILDRSGAERLLGQGDMLFIPPGTNQLQRLHGAYVDDDEIDKITSFLRSQGEPTYKEEILTEEDEEELTDGAQSDDPLYDDAVELIRKSSHASASFLQRHLKIGYNRAARLIECMEAQGIVGPADGARPREILF